MTCVASLVDNEFNDNRFLGPPILIMAHVVVLQHMLFFNNENIFLNSY